MKFANYFQALAGSPATPGACSASTWQWCCGARTCARPAAAPGCGQHWPLCNGDILPVAPTLKTIIEFTHRVTSGIDLAMVAFLLVWAFRAFPRRHPVRLGAVLSAIFLMTEALIGAALVLLEHVAKNQSSARGYSLSAAPDQHPDAARLPDPDRVVGAWGSRRCAWRGVPRGWPRRAWRWS